MPRKRKTNLSRISSQAQAQRLARSLESFEDAELRRQKQVERQAALKAAESPSKYLQRRAAEAKRRAAYRAAESKSQYLRRLAVEAKRQAASRAAESTSQYLRRLALQAERQDCLRAAESPSQYQQRLVAQAKRQAAFRAAETRKQRLEQAKRQNNLRAFETTEEKQLRLRVEAECQARLRNSKWSIQSQIGLLLLQAKWQAALKYSETPERPQDASNITQKSISDENSCETARGYGLEQETVGLELTASDERIHTQDMSPLVDVCETSTEQGVCIKVEAEETDMDIGPTLLQPVDSCFRINQQNTHAVKQENTIYDEYIIPCLAPPE